MRALYELQTAGYIRIEGALTPERTAALRQAIDQLMADDEAAWGLEQLQAMGQHGALRNLCDHGALFEELLADTPIFPLLDCLLGARYILHSYDGLVLLPDMGRFPWDFHTDLMALQGVAFPATFSPGINCLYYLDDVTTENGATWLVAGSHRTMWGDPPVEELAQLAFQALGRAGDALLFDARLWHCAGHNRSGTPRRLIKTLFCQPWLRPQMEYSRAVRPEVLERLDSRALRLLGAGTAPAISVAELRRSFARAGTP